MAAKRSGPHDVRHNSKPPVAGLVLAGAGLAIVAFGAAWYFLAKSGQEGTPPVPVVQNPERAPDPIVKPKDVAWWDNIPNCPVGAAVAQLNLALPQDQPLFASLGSLTDITRLGAYQKLVAELPKLMRNQPAKRPLALFLINCYAFEPADRNVAPFRDWFVNQIPKENAEYPAGFKSEDLERSFWALDVSMEALTHKKIANDRYKQLAEVLGKACGFDIDPLAKAVELRIRAEKLFGLRCYRNLAPTAARSLEDTLAIREALLKRIPELPPTFREKIDIEAAVRAFPAAKTSWPAYSTLLRECLKSEDQAIGLEVAALYAQADADLATKMEPVLGAKWKELDDKKLDQTAKAKAVRRTLGVPDPEDRQTQLEKLARESLAGAKSSVKQTHALFQETARLSHASTLACALLQQEKGFARFDELIEDVPEIVAAEPKPTEKTDGKAKEAAGDAKPADKPAVALKAGPWEFNDELRPGFFSKMHSVVLRRGKTYFMHMASRFDNYLHLTSPDGAPLAQNDDSGGGLNALIIYTAPADASYRIIATSFGGRYIGPYRITIQERPGFGGPRGMLPDAVPEKFSGKKKRAAKADQPQAADAAAADAQVDEAELNKLDINSPRTRVAALLKISSKLKGDLSEKDLTPRQASKIATYLVGTIQLDDEAAEVVPHVAPLAKSRNLLLAMADKIDKVDNREAVQKVGEAIVGAILEQPLQFAKEDDWRKSCRKLLLRQALELTGKENGATAAAEIIRDLYKEQGLLLGMEAADFESLTRPSQVLASMIKHLAAKSGNQDRDMEDKGYLDQLPRHVLAAQFVAQNDLEHTVLLQRIWIKLLAIHLAQQHPDRAREMRHVQEELSAGDRLSANVLQQLRSGEEKILRVWALALDLK